MRVPCVFRRCLCEGEKKVSEERVLLRRGEGVGTGADKDSLNKPVTVFFLDVRKGNCSL
jgi:hypothetical protein